jgi:hypothetical protein
MPPRDRGGNQFHIRPICKRHDIHSSSDLLSYELVAELATFGSERGGEWLAWSNALKEALDGCRQPAFDVNQALFICWQEIAERAETNRILVNATNIGQMIEGAENKEPLAAGAP